MGLKYHTVIFVPHARAKFRKWRISNRQAGLFSALFLLLTLAATFVTWSYFATSVDLEEVARLQTENDELREVNQSFEDSIRKLQQQLTEYEDRTKELAIMAGLEDVATPENRTTDVGVGGADTSIEFSGSRYDLSLIESRAEELGERLDEVKTKLDEKGRWISARPAIRPAKGIFTSGFGYRRDPMTRRRAFHHGLDISARPGKSVHATADGIVTRAGRIGSLGRAVYIAHGFGHTTRYGHLATLVVEPGQKVRRGDVIGYVGSSGRSTGYHLHYEVRLNNKPQNPLYYILDRPNRS